MVDNFNKVQKSGSTPAMAGDGTLPRDGVRLVPQCCCALQLTFHLTRMHACMQYGPVHTFTMFGSDVTYLLGSEASSRFWGT